MALSLSRSAGWAVLALVRLAREEERWLLARDISVDLEIPLPSLSKILNQLRCAGLLKTKRGYHGGFVLARPATQITLHDALVAIEGPWFLARCVLGLDRCEGDQRCPLHDFWCTERLRFERHLRQKTLADLAGPVEPSRKKRRRGAERAEAREVLSAGATATQATPGPEDGA